MLRERKKCLVPKCERWSVCKGFCHTHYMASLRAEGRHRSSAPKSNDYGNLREKRLENLLSLCDGFLHTCNALSDRILAQHGRARSPEAQSLYELANELRERIRAEITAPVPERVPSDWPPHMWVNGNGHRVGPKGGSA